MLRTTALVIAAALVAPALAQDPPKPAASPLTLTAKLDRASNVLGEDWQIDVTLENGSGQPVEVNELAYEEGSLSFSVKAEFAGGGAPVDYGLVIARPDPHLKARLGPPRVMLSAGKSLNFSRRFPTIAAGKYTITARYQTGKGEITATPVSMETAASGGGTKLVATVTTSQRGSFSFELYPHEAPANVTNFVDLVKRDFFKDMVFHRVVPKNWIQAGCPYGLGTGGPGYAVRAETEQTVKHEPGIVSLAGHEKSGYAGSQFLVTLATLPALDRKCTIIGKVLEGQMETVNAIGGISIDPTTERPKDDVRIENITIAVK